MRIREFTAEDIPEAVLLDNAVFPDKWNTASFEEELNKGYAHYFTAEENGVMLGFAGVWSVYETADISKIAVLPAARRKGTGGALLKALKDKSMECGCEKIMLEVRESNTAARSLYKKYGFTETGMRKGYYIGENAVVMELT